MSAGLALLQNFTPQQATTEPLTSVPSGAGERMGAAWEAAQAPDRYWNIQAARKDRAQKIIDDYHGLTGERLRNPFDMAPTMEEIRENPGQPTTAIYAKRLETLKQKTAAARSSLPDLGGMPQDFLDVDSIDPSIGSESGARRARDERLVDTGNGIPAFLAAGAGEMASPHGVASMFLPVSRLPYAAAEGIGASWLRNIGKEALLQGAMQAGVQIPASVIDYNTRLATGTAPTMGEIGHDIAAAGVGGAVFGGAFRAAHLSIRKLIGSDVAHGIEVPPAVRDAALVVESRDLYGDKNALGVPAAAHEAAIDRAVQDVAAGRAASVSDIVSPAAESRIAASLSRLEEAQSPPQTRVAPTEPPTGAEFDRFSTEQLHALIAQTEHMAQRMETTIAEGRLPAETAEHYRQQIDATNERLPAYRDELERRLQSATPEERQTLEAGARTEIEQATAASGEHLQPEVQKLTKMMDEPSVVTQPFEPPPEPTAGRPKTGETPQDKTMDVQVKQLLDEGGGATPEARRQYEAILQQEKETNIAIGCVGGGAL